MSKMQDLIIHLNGTPTFMPTETRYSTDTAFGVEQYATITEHPDPDSVLDLIEEARDNRITPLLTFSYDGIEMRYARIAFARKNKSNDKLYVVIEHQLDSVVNET